jgi:hypothetical protein
VAGADPSLIELTDAPGIVSVDSIEIVTSYAIRSILEKGAIFQLIFSLVCVVKRDFVEPCKNVSM